MNCRMQRDPKMEESTKKFGIAAEITIGYRLVGRNEANPDELSDVRRQRSSDEIDEHVVVEDFDPDISVHTSSSES